MKLLILILAVTGLTHAQEPDIDAIMSRVGINQAKAQDLRDLYVYNQKQLLRFVRANGKIAREERREYVVTPKLRRSKKQLVHFEGKYEEHGKFYAFYEPHFEHKGLDLDAELIDDMSRDMTDDNRARDGIARDLFPLTYHQQLKYTFQLLGTEKYQGREVYRVSFLPKPHMEGANWKGQALIDKEEFQPVLVTSELAWKMPLAVKIMLGTNIKGLGFTLSYRKLEDGVWFPASYGGEFEVRGLFVYRRTMSISLVNGDFHKLDVNSTIAYHGDKQSDDKIEDK
jgi:hypothetical protein